jgi:hypothetical protein
LLGIPVAIQFFGRLIWRVHHDRFLSSRVALSDRQFIDELGVGPEDVSACVVIRTVIAEMCEVPSEMIHPNDNTGELSKLMFHSDGWDPSGFGLALSFHRGVDVRLLLNALDQLPPFVPTIIGWRRTLDGARNLGAWTVEVVDCLRERHPGSFGKPLKKAARDLWDDWVP